ncbi:glycosyltransferase family 2 protein [Lacinutrix sp. Hel_I_90]|uniref:glycosyltransferase family 2 protein n=1 Tax=Lacinutrix sp. Hel_I_90 TaxID=1249999 RepID=UPI0009E3277E|nr:glycosyltransferase [Lacinutrix sp. Hel_I_90]
MSKPFTLIVCTYMRPQPVLQLLHSVTSQTFYPNEILIIDGSTTTETENILAENQFKNLKYFKVSAEDRGLTKQRNFGISKVEESSEIVCFLDDDIVLSPSYFEQLLGTYDTHPKTLAVGGYITNEVQWEKTDGLQDPSKFYYDGWMRSEPLRFKIRSKLALQPNAAPGIMPDFSHGRPVSFLPPSGKVYNIELLMGGASSYRVEIFKTLRFATYFEGYGLYEDADFSLRLTKMGDIYLNTNAQLVHNHDTLGRPNQFHYGKMVLRNGWYVWRVKYPKPSLKARVKWHGTAFLLTAIRIINGLTSKKKKEALTESLGRVVGWLSLVFNPPKVK